ncbi:MAG: AAA family ATPase [Pseudomonadales bacterium]|nr:AAA family ATPase [Pseudomonadales bacterium]
MSQLILLGGPPGTGKSTILTHLQKRFTSCAVLDADDVWRVHPDLEDEEKRRFVFRNVAGVVDGYLEAGYERVILSWVFAREDMVEGVEDALSHWATTLDRVYLVARPEVIRARLENRGNPEVIDFALSRLRMIEQLDYPKVDVSDLAPDEAARSVHALITRHNRHDID